ncbi:hypothetical protein [Streptomyces sp. NBC_01264]|uniref:hypothetical protein n=1 Tax=Streptomyces sp. NBC_01264 TaxID=2903804 RepID=UPI00225A16A2|nr:hypothetical protein [Streptomyces sp. NBC_01264]MCX4779116.1 hypothetical protein [Streptomyces sp. NBC_01264]
MYTLEVDKAGGTVVCGDFDYGLRTEVAQPVAQGTVSLSNLKSTVSTSLTGFDPRTQKTAPLKNTKVTVSHEGSARREVSTDAQGRLSSTVTFLGTESSTVVTVDLAATPERGPGTGRVRVAADGRKAEVVLDAASRNVTARYGEVVKLTGKAVMIAADGTRTPVPEGTALSTGINGAVTRTGADGRFERSVRALSPAGVSTWWLGGNAHPWLYGGGGLTKVRLLAATGIGDFKATIDAERRVTFTGGTVLKPAAADPGSTRMEVQYSADGKTGWTTRKTFGFTFNQAFAQTLPGEADGYWRLQYSGGKSSTGVILERTVTPPVRLTRTATAFTSFDAAPEPVRKGQTFTIKGTLRHGTPAKAYAGRTVVFCFRPEGSQTFVHQGQTKTAADGTFAHSFKADRTGTWIARYRDADGKHFDAECRRDELAVNP